MKDHFFNRELRVNRSRLKKNTKRILIENWIMQTTVSLSGKILLHRFSIDSQRIHRLNRFTPNIHTRNQFFSEEIMENGSFSCTNIKTVSEEGNSEEILKDFLWRSLSMPATLERSYHYSEMDLTYLTSRLIGKSFHSVDLFSLKTKWNEFSVHHSPRTEFISFSFGINSKISRWSTFISVSNLFLGSLFIIISITHSKRILSQSSSFFSPIIFVIFRLMLQVIDLSFIQEKRPIALNDLLFLCEKVYSYLFQSSKNIAVLHSSVNFFQKFFANQRKKTCGVHCLERKKFHWIC